MGNLLRDNPSLDLGMHTTSTTKPSSLSDNNEKLTTSLDSDMPNGIVEPAALSDAAEKQSIDVVDGHEQTQQLGPVKLALLLLGVGFAVFCMALDNTILGTAIPKISDTFHTISDFGWYAGAYLLTTCGFQLFFGKLYQFYSIKWVFIFAIVVFEVGSVICAVAPSSKVLILGRAVAGFGSGGVFSGGLLIIATSVPVHMISFFMSLVIAIYGVACVCGPLLGGVFTDSSTLTWRFCFWINLPFGFCTVVFILLFFRPPPKERSSFGIKEQFKQIDIPGTTVFLPGVVCLLLALQWGGIHYAWRSWRIVLLLVLAAILLTGFVIIQVISKENATVPVRIFRQRTIWSSALFGLCFNGAFFVMLYYAIKGVSAVKSGIMNIPMILSFVLLSLFSGTLTTWVGYYVPFFYLSVIFMAIGTGLLTTLDVDSGAAKWIGYQIVLGVGFGFGMQQPLLAAQTSLPMEDISIGTAVMIFMQVLGGSIFTSVAQNIFTNQLVNNLRSSLPSIDPQIVLRAGATELKNVVSSGSYNTLISAYSSSLTTSFFVAVGLASFAIFGAICVPWLSVRKAAPATTKA